MIFKNPSGAPELACDECGCRWADRMIGTCYECGAPISLEQQVEYLQALETFTRTRQGRLDAGASTPDVCSLACSDE